MATIKIPKILLPKGNVNLNKYSVIACDQFTSQHNYWDELKKIVGDDVSILNMIFPEIYLQKENNQNTIDQINKYMIDCYNSKFFNEINNFILVERKLNNGKTRLGLMIAVNLDDYSYTEKNNSLIKATEKTVVERLPIRVDIRKNAIIEFPHIMLLMDDKKGKIINELYNKKESYRKIYDFALNMNGGSIKGYEVTDSIDIIDKLMSLVSKERNILFAVGDGNHSLAAAKENWERLNKEGAPEDHPARYALCELVSLYDESLEFEPIHRVIMNDNGGLIKELQENLKGEENIKLVFKDKEYYISVPTPADAIKDIQDIIDKYLKEHKDVKIDYIHGDDYLLTVAKEKDGIAIFMPTIKKDELFDYVLRRGVLPRKAFSMGIAEDKRYYLEGRKIIN